MEKLIDSISRIENILTQDNISDINNCDRVITREIVKIRHLSKDDRVTELIFSIYNNWKVYSGQRINAGFAARRFIDLCYIFEDIASLKIHLNDLSDVS